MNNYYTLIYLTEHLNHKLYSTLFTFSISPHKNVWEGYFKNTGKKDPGFRLIFCSNPGETALFTDTYRPPKKSNVLNFFEPISNKEVEKAELAEGDRLLTITFKNAPDLIFQLFGNQANILLAEEGTIIDSFKNQSKTSGKPVPKPRKAAIREDPDPDLNARQKILYYDQKFPRHLIKPVIEYYKFDKNDSITIRDTVHKLTNAMRNNPSFRVLTTGNLCLIPEDLLPLENRKVFNNINDAVKFAYYKASHLRRFEKRLSHIQTRLTNQLNKTERALNQLEKSDKALERANNYEETGHLLMANAHQQIEPSDGKIVVKDLYNENELRTIEVKPALSVTENAKQYYDKAAKARRRMKESERRGKELISEKTYLEKLLQSLSEVENLYELADWEKKHEAELQQTGIHGKDQQKRSLPYHQTQFNGYQILIGKNARSNDKLTTDAHKEDIWLHARGAGGSHVVIRMNNNKEFPPKNIIYRAASYAAWHSQLKGSALVPVIITKRKYVSKPKGAPAGTVKVHREEVIMVEPEKPGT
jgi:predicted ribosome quality control (RQC) complex YloA/Tae2 family protein